MVQDESNFRYLGVLLGRMKATCSTCATACQFGANFFPSHIKGHLKLKSDLENRDIRSYIGYKQSRITKYCQNVLRVEFPLWL